MAKNGLLSEYRRDHGKDIPFVMSDVAEIERILPPLPKEGPYPPRAFNTVEDLIDTDLLLARRYVQGLVEEGVMRGNMADPRVGPNPKLGFSRKASCTTRATTAYSTHVNTSIDYKC